MTFLLQRIGPLGCAALAVLALSIIAYAAVQRPLERELQALQRTAQQDRPRNAVVHAGSASGQIGSFYRFFEHPQSSSQWLAKIYAIGKAVGIEMRAADYRVLPTGARILRYQISLPVTGTYAQAWAFAENLLNEIPILSLDQVTFRRKRAADSELEVDLVVTLHLLES
jgi:hypothetical protein